MIMGGPITCLAAHRAKVLLFAAGATVMCLGNLDCQAGTIVSQSRGSQVCRISAVEIDFFAPAGVYESVAGQSETGNASPASPLPTERPSRWKAPMKALLGECGGA